MHVVATQEDKHPSKGNRSIFMLLEDLNVNRRGIFELLAGLN